VDVAQSELLTESELKALQRVEEAFKRLRIELHLLTGRAEDRLLFDLQPRLAEIYGFPARRFRW
jgi:[protein-PII] uridylyltransferase